MKRFVIYGMLVCGLAGCVGIPDGLQAVRQLDAQRYLGTWYEVARLENRFEAGLEQVSARYTSRDDGGITVLNRGYDPVKQAWKEAEGRAYFIGEPGEGRLKVAFFWPFYGAYNVLALDEKNYEYALVTGPDRSWLWLLSRTPKMDAWVQDTLLEKAKTMGFDTSKLVFPAPVR